MGKQSNELIKGIKTKKIRTTQKLHGVTIVDNYRWLEKSKSQAVKDWTARQEKYTYSILNKLPQLKPSQKRLNYLWKYDEKGIPDKLLKSKRQYRYTKKKNQEKWVLNTREHTNRRRYCERDTAAYCKELNHVDNGIARQWTRDRHSQQSRRRDLPRTRDAARDYLRATRGRVP